MLSRIVFERGGYPRRRIMTKIIQIPLQWSNAYLLIGDRPILVDTGSPRETAKILRAMQSANVALQDLALILHTHGHHDHCGNSWELKKLSKAPLAIHQADVSMLHEGRNGELTPTRLSAWGIKLLLTGTKFTGVGANRIIKDEFSLTEYGVAAEVIFTPGHTVGSLSIVCQDGQAIIGDLLMGGYFGGQVQPHQPRYHYFAYDLSVVHWSLKKLLKHKPTHFYVGHGGPLEVSAVRDRFGAFLG